MSLVFVWLLWDRWNQTGQEQRMFAPFLVVAFLVSESRVIA